MNLDCYTFFRHPTASHVVFAVRDDTKESQFIYNGTQYDINSLHQLEGLWELGELFRDILILQAGPVILVTSDAGVIELMTEKELDEVIYTKAHSIREAKNNLLANDTRCPFCGMSDHPANGYSNLIYADHWDTPRLSPDTSSGALSFICDNCGGEWEVTYEVKCKEIKMKKGDKDYVFEGSEIFKR